MERFPGKNLNIWWAAAARSDGAKVR